MTNFNVNREMKYVFEHLKNTTDFQVNLVVMTVISILLEFELDLSRNKLGMDATRYNQVWKHLVATRQLLKKKPESPEFIAITIVVNTINNMIYDLSEKASYYLFSCWALLIIKIDRAGTEGDIMSRGTLNMLNEFPDVRKRLPLKTVVEKFVKPFTESLITPEEQYTIDSKMGMLTNRVCSECGKRLRKGRSDCYFCDPTLIHKLGLSK
jgi:hypothetical protein